MLQTESINNKKVEVLNIIESKCPDLIVATETWLKLSIKTSEILPANYNIYRKDRKNEHRGVLIAVINKLLSEEVTGIENKDDVEAVFAKINLVDRGTLVVGGVYRLTNNDVHYAENNTHVRKCVKKVP